MSSFEEVIKKTEQLNQDFESIKPKIDKMLFYLEDDATTNTQGLISRLTKVEKRIDELLTENKIDKGKKSTYFFIGGAVIWLISNLDKLINFFSTVTPKN